MMMDQVVENTKRVVVVVWVCVSRLDEMRPTEEYGWIYIRTSGADEPDL